MAFKTQILAKRFYFKNAHLTPQSPKGEASPHTIDCVLATPPLGGRGVRDGFSESIESII